MPRFKEAIINIRKAKTIAIASHINPDGDSIGSLLSLGLGLRAIGKRVYMISADGVPKRYRFLPGAERIIRHTKDRVDLAIAVDCSNKEILGRSYGIFKNASTILEIDHHEFRRPLGGILFTDNQAGAVGELVYLLLKRMAIRINKDISENILTSIIVETNSFRLPNVRPLTFKICTDLMEKNVDFAKIANAVFWSRSKESVLLSGITMSRCKFIRNGELVWSIIRDKDFASTKAKDEDADAIPEEMRSIEGVKIVVLLREKNRNTLRVSLRSKGRINVAGIAEQYNGGGHFDIAGCYIPNREKAIKNLLSLAEGLLD